MNFSVSDFFVLRGIPQRGLGQRAPHELYDRFRGQWKVEQFAENKPEVEFWRRVIDGYCGKFAPRR